MNQIYYDIYLKFINPQAVKLNSSIITDEYIVQFHMSTYLSLVPFMLI